MNFRIVYFAFVFLVSFISLIPCFAARTGEVPPSDNVPDQVGPDQVGIDAEFTRDIADQIFAVAYAQFFQNQPERGRLRFILDGEFWDDRRVRDSIVDQLIGRPLIDRPGNVERSQISGPNGELLLAEQPLTPAIVSEPHLSSTDLYPDHEPLDPAHQVGQNRRSSRKRIRDASPSNDDDLIRLIFKKSVSSNCNADPVVVIDRRAGRRGAAENNYNGYANDAGIIGEYRFDFSGGYEGSDNEGY
jgi:hypothetical protein